MAIDGILFHRRSIRLKGYDYTSPGAYFVTIVSYKRENLFGVIVGGEMKLNEWGDIAWSEWFNTEKHRPYVHLHSDAFVVMPNHVHGIVWIDQSNAQPPSKGAAPLRPYWEQQNPQKHVVQSCSLGAIVRGYKSAVTYRINEMRNTRGSPVWHRNYYEHILHTTHEMDHIAAYILSNPSQWLADPEFTS